MCGLPGYPYGEGSICFWCYYGVQKRHATIICSFLNSELNGRSIVLMFLRNSSLCEWCCITKISSTYLFHILGGAVLLRLLCSQRLPCRCWPLLDLLVTPWQLHLFVHKTHLGTEIGVIQAEPQQLYDVISCHDGSIWEICVQFQFILDDF